MGTSASLFFRLPITQRILIIHQGVAFAGEVVDVGDARVHFQDIGTEFIVEIPDRSFGHAFGAVLDVSEAITKEIKFRLPDGTTKAFTASFTTDGTDGLIQFRTFSTSELDQLGRWDIQGRVRLPTGDWHTVEGQFEVFGIIITT